MRNVEDVIESMFVELNALNVSLLREPTHVASAIPVVSVNSPRAAEVALKNEELRAFKRTIAKIFDKAAFAVNDIAKLKRKVSLYIHPDHLKVSAKKFNQHPFIVNLNLASHEIQTQTIAAWNKACEFRQEYEKARKGDLVEVFEIVLDVISKNLKSYPNNATTEQIEKIDTANIEALLDIRDLFSWPFLNTIIDVLYQYYRYPEFIKNVLYYISATVNALLALGGVTANLALFLATSVINVLRSVLERFYLHQFDEFMNRKFYVYYGKKLNSDDNQDIDESGTKDDQYAHEGKSCLKNELRDFVAMEKMQTCFAKPFVVTTQGYLDMYNVLQALTPSGDTSDDTPEEQRVWLVKQFLQNELSNCFVAYRDTIDLTSLDQEQQNKILLGLQIVFIPAVAAQLEDADFDNAMRLQRTTVMDDDMGLSHYRYVFSSIFEDLTKPLPPEDNVFKTMFLRILRLGFIALPAALLISFPLSLAEALCLQLMEAVRLVVLGVKLLSAVVFALPLYIYDALAWAFRCCSSNPTPQADKNQVFKYLAGDLVWMMQLCLPSRTGEETREQSADVFTPGHGAEPTTAIIQSW